jgi:hypothetical protein
MSSHTSDPSHDDAFARAALCPSDAEELREEVRRIVESPAFKGSRRTQQLLDYIVENGLFGRADRLKERTIGVEVFGRPADYVTGEDSIVRVAANDLRKRLTHYYLDTGTHSKVRIELPAGSYIPVICRAASPGRFAGPEAGAAEGDAAAVAPAQTETRTRQSALHAWVWIAAASWVLLTSLGLAVWSRGGVIQKPSSVLPPWPFSRVFSPSEQTELVLADSSYGCLRNMSDHPASLADYLSPQYPRNLFLKNPDEADRRVQRELASATLTSFADVSMVITVLRVAGAQQDRVHVRSAREFRVRDNDQGNSILVGCPTSNPWASVFNEQLNFVSDRDKFRNKDPKPGEPSEYDTRLGTGEPGDDYALIALVPAPNRERAVLLVQGTRQEGTEAASLFLREPEKRMRLKQHLGLSDSAANQAYFEVLLRTRRIGGAPGATDIVASRVHK